METVTMKAIDDYMKLLVVMEIEMVLVSDEAATRDAYASKKKKFRI